MSVTQELPFRCQGLVSLKAKAEWRPLAAGIGRSGCGEYASQLASQLARVTPCEECRAMAYSRFVNTPKSVHGSMVFKSVRQLASQPAS